jgi:hypothetical protein
MSDWGSLREAALISESVDDGVLRSVYKGRADVARRLRELIKAEENCCPFLEFTVYEEHDVIRLEVAPRPKLHER